MIGHLVRRAAQDRRQRLLTELEILGAEQEARIRRTLSRVEERIVEAREDPYPGRWDCDQVETRR